MRDHGSEMISQQLFLSAQRDGFQDQFPFFQIESGSQAGSYIESLWPERTAMTSGHFVCGGLAQAYMRAKNACKRTVGIAEAV